MNFDVLTNFLENIDKNQIPDCEIAVFKDHKCLYSNKFTAQGYDKGEADKDLYYLFSCSKPITCTAALRLVEEGKMKLSDPVSKYLPEFGRLYVKKGDVTVPAKNVLTVEHLFSMQGGFGYGIGDEEIVKVQKASNNKASTRETVAAMAKMPLFFEPGEQYRYSLCHDILAAVVEVVTGKSFGEYLNEVVFKPLGMKDFTFVPTDEIMARMKKQYYVDKVTNTATLMRTHCNFRLTENYESGGAGLIGSLKDYVKFTDALACGETADGYRLLRPETVELMKKDLLLDKVGYMPAKISQGYGYGLGVRTMIDREKGNSLSPIGEFGWDGAAGSFCMIDTENHLSVFYGQHILACNYVYAYVHPSIRNFVYKALDA